MSSLKSYFFIRLNWPGMVSNTVSVADTNWRTCSEEPNEKRKMHVLTPTEEPERISTEREKKERESERISHICNNSLDFIGKSVIRNIRSMEPMRINETFSICNNFYIWIVLASKWVAFCMCVKWTIFDWRLLSHCVQTNISHVIYSIGIGNFIHILVSIECSIFAIPLSSPCLISPMPL